MTKEFLDSNILIYAFTADPRATAARAVIERGCVISVQGLNEFASVARRKLGRSWAEVRGALADIRTICTAILSVDVDTHAAALDIAERYGVAMFDAVMLAAALRADCETFWSEDMQHGMVIEGKLRIANPFRDA